MSVTTDARIEMVELADVGLSVTSAGPGAGPVVLLLHGFAGIGYSWRHQIPALADAGCRVLAPDSRGVGWSETADSYTLSDLANDVVGLLDALDISDAILIGHGVGALVAQATAHDFHDRVRGVAQLCVQARSHSAPEDDPYATLRRLFWTACGERPHDLAPDGVLPKGLPSFLSPGEFENYFRAYARSGFGPAIESQANALHAALLGHQTIGSPTLRIDGDRDPLAGHRVNHTADTAVTIAGGHWLQEESPTAITDLLLDFVRRVDG